jgi:hypothetical protein
MVLFADPALPVAQVLKAASDSHLPPYSRALARNLLGEHRVSAERFAAFSAFAGNLTEFASLQQAIEEYQGNEVRPLVKWRVAPAYARQENENNKVELLARAHVATVLNLTRLGRVYAEANATFKMPEFHTYAVTNPRDAVQVNDFLSARLTDPGQQERFLKAVLWARRRYRKELEARVHPTWVAEWTSLRPFLDPDRPERWLQAVGVPCDYPAWLAVFRYPVGRSRRRIDLFRPTQLDAGWYAHHFPSPPQAAKELGGHTMYLWQPLQNGSRIPRSLGF